MLIKEISKIAEVGLDSVDPVGIIEVLESHSQPLSNEELHNLAQQLTEQQKEDEDGKGRGTKEMQTKDLTDVLSAIDMAAEKLCDIGPDWECRYTVKRGIRAMLHPYYDILQEKTKKLLNHGPGLLQQNKKWLDWYFLQLSVIFYISN